MRFDSNGVKVLTNFCCGFCLFLTGIAGLVKEGCTFYVGEDGALCESQIWV